MELRRLAQLTATAVVPLGARAALFTPHNFDRPLAR